jgi:hypothetical protein
MCRDNVAAILAIWRPYEIKGGHISLTKAALNDPFNIVAALALLCLHNHKVA